MTDNLTHKVDRLLADVRHARKRLNAARQNAGHARRQVIDARAAQRLVQQVAQGVQERAHARITAIVSRCLQAVFGRGFGFKIEFDRKRGKTEARLVLLEDGLELDPMDEAAGGVIDVAAFALRLACLMLQRPARRRLLVLDEPFKMVSERKDYRERLCGLLKALAEEMEVQIIMVTHSRELEIGKVVEMK